MPKKPQVTGIEACDIAEALIERFKPLEHRLLKPRCRGRYQEPPLEEQQQIVDSLPSEIREAVNESPVRYIFTKRARAHVLRFIARHGIDYVAMLFREGVYPHCPIRSTEDDGGQRAGEPACTFEADFDDRWLAHGMDYVEDEG